MDKNRKKKLVELINENPAVSVTNLAEILDVTPTTIRRDLNQLQKDGIIRRTHGGAVLLTDTTTPFHKRGDVNVPGKKRIAYAALEFVKPELSVILDAGSTVFELAKIITQVEKISIITNSIPAAMYLANSDASIIMIGGYLINTESATIGPDAEKIIERMRADLLFISSAGIRGPEGLTVSSPFQVSIKAKMIASANKVIALLDHTKFESESLSLFASFDDIDVIITDRDIENESILEAIHTAGIDLRVV